ncbi:MAG: gliding motility-associated C-terminal domain-containing protein [Chitinophagaceae bacterium]|nr:gliding motility-associated C-terminal domain-containing protein [Chitinophagaceae bacterium]
MVRVVRIVILLFAAFLYFIDAGAQLCQGSLGVPIINKTFGAGANPGNPLAAASTTYQYVSTDCPNDGYYTVRNNTSACFADSWHSIAADHTGDGSGYFMLVNASMQPGAFYVDTVRGLCSGTTFEFATWIMNVLKTTACNPSPIRPNLTFSIERTDGTLIQNYSTGDIPSQANPTWQQFGFFFNTPVGISDIVLRIVNNAPGGCGNDLALDDITFRPCGPQLTPAITGFPVNTDTLCEGSAASYTFTCAVSPGFSNPSFQWQQSFNGGSFTDITGATSTTLVQNFLTTAATGTYTFRLSAAEAGNMSSALCRVVSPLITIQVEKNPVTTVTGISPVCERGVLSMAATGGSQYQWNGPAAFSSTSDVVTISNAQVSQSGKYYVLVSNAAGCNHLDSITVMVNPSPTASTSFSTADLCEGDTLQLLGSGGTIYTWQPSAGLSSSVVSNPVAFPLSSVLYSVIVGNSFNCSDTATIDLVVKTRPVANAGPDKITVAGLPVQLAGSAGGQDITYTWSPALYLDDPLSLSPIASPLAEIDYMLIVTSNVGCGTATDVMKVYIYNDVFVPTGFTPNNDGLNDTWNIPALAAFPNFELLVYNRNGEVVFQNSKTNKPWDGRYKGLPQPSGVYIYVIDLKDSSRPGLLKGFVHIIR